MIRVSTIQRVIRNTFKLYSIIICYCESAHWNCLAVEREVKFFCVFNLISVDSDFLNSFNSCAKRASFELEFLSKWFKNYLCYKWDASILSTFIFLVKLSKGTEKIETSILSKNFILNFILNEWKNLN